MLAAQRKLKSVSESNDSTTSEEAMNHKRLLPRMIGLILVSLLLVACSTPQPATTPTPIPPTPTPTPVPPTNTPTPISPIPDLIAAASPSVVRICVAYKTDKDGTCQVIGTAFVVREGGLLATALHVVDQDLPEGAQFVALPPNRYTVDPDTDRIIIVKEDYEHDLALVRAPALAALPPLTIDPAPQSRPGEDALVIGYPLGNLVLTSVRAMIAARFPSTLENRTKPTTLLKLDAAVNKGNSGGPVIDVLTGRVVGIVNLREGSLSAHLKHITEKDTTTDICVNELCLAATLRDTIRELDRFIHMGIGYAVSSEHLAGLLD